MGFFAGTAGLTSAFAAAGWVCAPPVDIMDVPEFDMLNAMFVGIVIGLVLEGRFALIHLGPPCSSFSMACNRAWSSMMRNRQYPEGLPGMEGTKLEKILLGNALADVAVQVGLAQIRGKGQWCWEQPGTSLMWLYKAVKDFMAEHAVAIVTFDACGFGAPWKKATTVAASFQKEWG